MVDMKRSRLSRLGNKMGTELERKFYLNKTKEQLVDRCMKYSKSISRLSKELDKEKNRPSWNRHRW